jgi:hypothetical protein
MAATGTSTLERRALRLEYLTITWNAVEAVVAVGSGIIAGSIALIGFGFDSSIEAFASLIVVWQLRGASSEEREHRALRMIAVTFFVLAAYVTIESDPRSVFHQPGSRDIHCRDLAGDRLAHRHADPGVGQALDGTTTKQPNAHR